ncbi:ATP-binding cassette domain-containing protein [Spirosoma taeanense]|uniref:ATP-binding cassette domain-containing protein n=1 Tax=Spirosoma taeanense TaxID=2735870 RepID=A0A6M5YBN0_9BACT|nr:ATP-binding cassette domain-containing protein [Spirosoma taeanense]QJW91435.1 ATP-binding cassette domain-containing protein [Spirosoma taeanense]
MREQAELIQVTALTVRRSGQIVLKNSTFTLKLGECWAIVGPTGSGKTTLLQALAGQLAVPPGSVSRHKPVAFVSFREESRQFSYSAHFYQQRYHATMSDADDGGPVATLRQFLGVSDSPEEAALIRRLGLEPLLDFSFLKLSNGQTRKARIGKALLQNPSILLLDNLFVGLDAAFRADLVDWLGELTALGLTLVLVGDSNNLPPFVTHVLALDEGQMVWAGLKEEYAPRSETQGDIPLPTFQTSPKPADFNEAFRLTDVTIRYGENIILDSINWHVGAGERWALLGQNGAGKSVLLSLLYGDHPQAYATNVCVFDHRRGRSRGQSIWDVKRRIGFVSPELHLYFPQHLTARQVVLTGLTDTLTVPARVPVEAEADLVQMLHYFGLSHTVNRVFGGLSSGEQRLVLLVRALIKQPPVLILDEPFQALDARSVRLAQRLLDNLPARTILFVTHDRNELPDSINRTFLLEKPSRKPDPADILVN